MSKLNVVNLSGETVGEFELLDEVFAAGINDALLWEAVKHYRAALRQGTAATKTRKNVSGSGKKLWKQKGTGRARIGSIRSPLWRSGGTVHGPQPRSYEYQFPRKKLMGALRSAIAAKIDDGKFIIVDSLAQAEGKTKLYAQALKKLGTRQDNADRRSQPEARREPVPWQPQPERRGACAFERSSSLRPASL